MRTILLVCPLLLLMLPVGSVAGVRSLEPVMLDTARQLTIAHQTGPEVAITDFHVAPGRGKTFLISELKTPSVYYSGGHQLGYCIGLQRLDESGALPDSVPVAIRDLIGLTPDQSLDFIAADMKGDTLALLGRVYSSTSSILPPYTLVLVSGEMEVLSTADFAVEYNTLRQVVRYGPGGLWLGRVTDDTIRVDLYDPMTGVKLLDNISVAEAPGVDYEGIDLYDLGELVVVFPDDTSMQTRIVHYDGSVDYLAPSITPFVQSRSAVEPSIRPTSDSSLLVYFIARDTSFTTRYAYYTIDLQGSSSIGPVVVAPLPVAKWTGPAALDSTLVLTRLLDYSNHTFSVAVAVIDQSAGGAVDLDTVTMAAPHDPYLDEDKWLTTARRGHSCEVYFVYDRMMYSAVVDPALTGATLTPEPRTFCGAKQMHGSLERVGNQVLVYFDQANDSTTRLTAMIVDMADFGSVLEQSDTFWERHRSPHAPVVRRIADKTFVYVQLGAYHDVFPQHTIMLFDGLVPDDADAASAIALNNSIYYGSVSRSNAMKMGNRIVFDYTEGGDNDYWGNGFESGVLAVDIFSGEIDTLITGCSMNGVPALLAVDPDTVLLVKSYADCTHNINWLCDSWSSGYQCIRFAQDSLLSYESVPSSAPGSGWSGVRKSVFTISAEQRLLFLEASGEIVRVLPESSEFEILYQFSSLPRDDNGRTGFRAVMLSQYNILFMYAGQAAGNELYVFDKDWNLVHTGHLEFEGVPIHVSNFVAGSEENSFFVEYSSFVGNQYFSPRVFLQEFSVDVMTDTPEDNPIQPNTFALEQNYPNPFNPSTIISFTLPARAEVALTVYNILGQQVKELLSTDFPAGEHRVVWDGTNESGERVGSGVYFYKLKAGEWIESRKMLLLK